MGAVFPFDSIDDWVKPGMVVKRQKLKTKMEKKTNFLNIADFINI